jgi:hypothetical protein
VLLRSKVERRAGVVVAGLVIATALARPALASTYVVYIPLDSPIYQELDTLNGLGMLETYLSEVRPISRVEAARLTLEAERIASGGGENVPSPALPLVRAMIEELHRELATEIGWLENDAEDDQPTMIKPIERFEVQYIYSTGRRRGFGPFDNINEQLHATEATPLLPNNDDLPTSVSNNEVTRTSAWAGLDGFFTVYGEGAIAGPLSRSPAGVNGSTRSRISLLRGEAVADFGNTAISFGEHEMRWGTGYFGALSQGDNARPFPALRMENVHPSYLPGWLRYLGPMRYEIFFGELDHFRPFITAPGQKGYYPYPWLSGQTVVFKPLATFELGITHVVMFGGSGNNQYSLAGFLGRATGISTGSPQSGNTNSQAGFTTKFYFPSLRNAYLYLDVLGEDNLTFEVPSIGRLLPFAAVSYQGGIVVPRVTADGLTSARLEFINTSQRYGFHSDSLYWSYKDRLMGDPVGPNAFQINTSVSRWLSKSLKLDVDYFHTERDPEKTRGPGQTEFSNGMALQMTRLPQPAPAVLRASLLGISVYLGCEWVHNLDTLAGSDTFRVAVQVSLSLSPGEGPLIYMRR